MSYPPGQNPGQPYDPQGQPAPEGQPTLPYQGEQQTPGYPAGDPTRVNPGYPADPTQVNPASQPYYSQAQPYDPQAQQYPPGQPYDPQGQPSQPYPQAQYPQGQPYDPQSQPSQPYPQAQYPQSQPYPQAQYPPGGQYPPPGQPYPPYGSGSGGNGAKIAIAIIAVLVAVVLIGGTLAVVIVKNAAKDDEKSAYGSTTTSEFSVPTITKLPSFSIPPPPTFAPPPPTRTTTWIAATYNEGTNQVHWIRSTVSLEHASAEVLAACGSTCQDPIWSSDGCIAIAFGQRGGWGSDWGNSITEAQNKAMSAAQNRWGVDGPFEFWSKCAYE